MKGENKFDGLRSMIYEAVGHASMCWEFPEKAGVFDTEEASRVGDELYDSISDMCGIEKNENEMKKSKGLVDPSEILSIGTVNRVVFSQILEERVTSFRDFHYGEEDEKKLEDALDTLKNAHLINSVGNQYYPTSYGLRKGRQLNISETPRAWF